MRTALRILATRLWWRHAYRLSGAATHADFIRKFDGYASPRTGYGLDPRLLHAWETGKHYVSRGSVHRVESCVPRTCYVFALATLLQPVWLSAPAAGRAMEKYFETRPDGSRVWRLPREVAGEGANDGPVSIDWDDSGTLAARRDFLGLLAMLVLLRQSTTHTPLERLRQHTRDLYGALPSISRLEWVRPDVDLLLQCIEQMMEGIYWLDAHVEINWKRFRAQLLHPKPWVGTAPWIRHADDGIFQSDRHRYPGRPVPLLDGVEPLWRYIENAMPDEVEPKRRSRSG